MPYVLWNGRWIYITFINDPKMCVHVHVYLPSHAHIAVTVRKIKRLIVLSVYLFILEVCGPLAVEGGDLIGRDALVHNGGDLAAHVTVFRHRVLLPLLLWQVRHDWNYYNDNDVSMVYLVK